MSAYLSVEETLKLSNLNYKVIKTILVNDPEFITFEELKTQYELLYDKPLDLSSKRLIKLKIQEVIRYPNWQIHPSIFPNLKALITVVGKGFAVYGWLTTPNGGLDGKTPRQALEDGCSIERIQQLAEAN